jgi:hypothetical protein
MKRITTVAGIILLTAFVLAACGKGAKDKKGDPGDMKAKLEKLKKEKNALDADIRKLEDQIAKADPKAAQQALKLVAVDTIRIRDFSHYIELQENRCRRHGLCSPKRTGRAGKAIYVKTGQRVSRDSWY